MMGHDSWNARPGESLYVRRPGPGDAVGSTLRGVYGEPPALPDDMARLLRHLERETPGD